MVEIAAPARWLQGEVGLRLREKVSGPDPMARVRKIRDATGPRWFVPGDPIWDVHESPAMFPGGIAALLLQSLHPSAMAGVAGHSDYRGDPWGRLQRTSYYLAATTYGTVSTAERVIAHVSQVHESISGVDADGISYAAGDPHLLRWVHCAEVYSFLSAYQAFAPTPLSLSAANTYVSQTRNASERLGARDLPQTVDELYARLEAYRPELRATAQCQEARHFLLARPPVRGVGRLGYAGIARGGVACLPEWALTLLDLKSPTRMGRLVGHAATRTVGWAMAGAREPQPTTAR